MPTANKRANRCVIRRAVASDADAVFAILSDCAAWLSQKGMDHWKNAHSRERVEERIRDREVYLIYKENAPAGTITFGLTAPAYYKTADINFWSDNGAKSGYANALAVSPTHHGENLATQLLSFAEARCREEGAGYLRLDAVSHYEELTKFYLDRGYKLMGKRTVHVAESNFFEKKTN